MESSGAVLVADNNNHRILRIDPATGDRAVVAGTGVAGYSGDGGPATQAQLNSPFNVAVDAGGNIFIADTGNNRIRVVLVQTGTIITVAGNGTYTSDGDGGPAAEAGIYGPMGLAFDGAGNLFIGEQRGGRIRLIDAYARYIRTIAGNGSFAFTPDGAPALGSSLNSPGFLAFDRSGNLLFSEFGLETHPPHRYQHVNAGHGRRATGAPPIRATALFAPRLRSESLANSHSTARATCISRV